MLHKSDGSFSEKKRSQAESETKRLALLIASHIHKDGTGESSIPGLYLNRYSQVEPSDYSYTMYWPTIGMVAQGKKTVKVGAEETEYGGSKIIVVPVAIPVRMQTVQASATEPFLGVGVYLNPQKIAALIPRVFPDGLPTAKSYRAKYVLESEPELIAAISRLVACLDDREDGGLLAALATDEIFIRLLRSPIGVHVAETALAESNVRRIAEAIAWLQSHFAEPLKMAELAQRVHLSESSFRAHFKSVTSMSPLQYQKELRLQEARRLMLVGEHDATTACGLVGYISDAQFSRDYRRLFGSPPNRDIAKWKQTETSL
ncbi:AraC family transcriptional regulator [Saccharibacillus sacchari]|uniref:AraC family transcriptional regulator n=1 Tax=Saccharibacillus sacchari TaxID=456493 RepID=A0ACC6PIG2_9BACL